MFINLLFHIIGEQQLNKTIFEGNYMKAFEVPLPTSTDKINEIIVRVPKAFNSTLPNIDASDPKIKVMYSDN